MLPKLLMVLSFYFLSCASDVKNETPIRNYNTFNEAARSFCKKEHFNEEYYFLIDLSIHSGKNRFFIYDFKTNAITSQNLVTHGSCDGFAENATEWEKATFSNTTDSHCSAKGKYKIGKRDSSSWGIKVKYWLQGLENTNNNSEERVVVLHSWSAVANEEVYPKFSPLSWGCPAVSDDFMKTLDVKLLKSAKPVLLWIVE